MAQATDADSLYRAADSAMSDLRDHAMQIQRDLDDANETIGQYRDRIADLEGIVADLKKEIDDLTRSEASHD